MRLFEINSDISETYASLFDMSNNNVAFHISCHGEIYKHESIIR